MRRHHRQRGPRCNPPRPSPTRARRAGRRARAPELRRDPSRRERRSTLRRTALRCHSGYAAGRCRVACRSSRRVRVKSLAASPERSRYQLVAPWVASRSAAGWTRSRVTADGRSCPACPASRRRRRSSRRRRPAAQKRGRCPHPTAISSATSTRTDKALTPCWSLPVHGLRCELHRSAACRHGRPIDTLMTMKKTNLPKRVSLRLNKDTVRILACPDLREVVGGFPSLEMTVCTRCPTICVEN